MKPLFALLALLPGLAMAQPTPLAGRTQAEIDHLMGYIARSDCRFSRNGSWHDMDKARSHVAMKLDYLRDRGQIDSAESFIEKAATKSSLSGESYLVQCAGAEPVPSAGWLKAELARYRKN